MISIPSSSPTGFDGFCRFVRIRLLQQKIVPPESFPLLPKLLVCSDGRGNHHDQLCHATAISVCLVFSYGVCSLLLVLELDSLGFDIVRRRNNNPYNPPQHGGMSSVILYYNRQRYRRCSNFASCWGRGSSGVRRRSARYSSS